MINSEKLITRNGNTKRARHPLYECWMNMRKRCDNPNNPAYHNYGGRGITVCADWMKFENFLRDMGSSWHGKGWTIHRNNNEEGYSKENCSWETRSTQAYFRRPKSEEHKRHLSESVKALGPHNEEHNRNISEGLKSAYNKNPRGPEVYEKISQALTGRPLTEDHKKRISEGKMNKRLGKEHRQKMAESQKARRLRERSSRRT